MDRGILYEVACAECGGPGGSARTEGERDCFDVFCSHCGAFLCTVQEVRSMSQRAANALAVARRTRMVCLLPRLVGNTDDSEFGDDLQGVSEMGDEDAERLDGFAGCNVPIPDSGGSRSEK